MKPLFIIPLVLMSMIPTICWSLDSHVREQDWQKSVYFCEVTKRVRLERDTTHILDLFKFQMTVTRTGVKFSEDTFHNLDQIHFGGSYDYWTAKNTYYETTVEFSPDALGYKQYNKGYFLYYTGSNVSPGGPYAEVSAIFADCYEFK